jgi:hypothetical protein
MWLSSMFVPEGAETSEATAARVISAAAVVDDLYLQYVLSFFIGWDQVERGRVAKATNTADDILAVGRRINDPRSIAWGMALKAIRRNARRRLWASGIRGKRASLWRARRPDRTSRASMATQPPATSSAAVV